MTPLESKVFDGIQFRFICKSKIYLKFELFIKMFVKFGSRIKEIKGINIVSNDWSIQQTVVIAQYRCVHPDFAAYYLNNIPVFWFDSVNFN